MQRGYSHLSGESHNEKAEVAGGDSEPDDEGGSRLSPDTCRTCGNVLPDDAKACPRCGAVFTPDAKAVTDSMVASVKQDYRETDPEDTETMEKLDTLDELLNDPEVKAGLLEKLSEG